MLNRISTAIVGAIVGLAMVAALGFAQDAPKQKKVKDQGEYDIYNSVSKETDPNKKLALLATWKEKYPDSDFKNERMLTELQAYSQIAAGTMGAKPTPESLANGDKAANTILSNLDTYFAAGVKPEKVSDADWQKARSDTEATAHLTLGWIAMQNKDYPKAEQEFTKVLTLNGNNAQASYWLGTVIALQRKVERQPEALYQFARAIAVTGPGALPDAAKKTTDEYLT
nr:tetratricopeptide repeat protein [Acidobacteriota bacterium]